MEHPENFGQIWVIWFPEGTIYKALRWPLYIKGPEGRAYYNNKDETVEKTECYFIECIYIRSFTRLFNKLFIIMIMKHVLCRVVSSLGAGVWAGGCCFFPFVF